MSALLRQAIFKAAKELEQNDWDIMGNAKTARDFEESHFYQVMAGHILPLVDKREMKKIRNARIIALRLELEALLDDCD